MIHGVPISCRKISWDAVRWHVLGHVRKRHWKNWTVVHNGEELNEDVWFELVKTFITKGA